MTATTLQYGTQEYIDAARKVMKPSPVVSHKIPKWMRPGLTAAKRALKLQTCTNRADYLVHEIATRGLLDHWGSTTWHGHDAFVTEPYAFDEKLVRRFAELLGDGVTWRLSANSWHFPGRTFRIVFWERTA